MVLSGKQIIWHDESANAQRAAFVQRFDNLNSTYDIPALTQKLNTEIVTYVNSGGVQKSPQNYQTITDLLTQIDTAKQQYSMLQNDITMYIRNTMQDQNLGGILTENGTLQTEINKLQKHIDKKKIDVDSALARDELLRSRDTDITPHQLFLMDRPVRRGMIPYLWAIGVLFIGVGLIIGKMMIPNVQLDESIFQMFTNFFSNQMVLISLLVASGIAILFLKMC
jgi:hypothetical protein